MAGRIAKADLGDPASLPKKGGLGWTIAALGVVGAGFAVGLHRLVWAIFYVLAALWLGFNWWASQHANGHDGMWLLTGFGPIVVIGLILRLVEGIVLALVCGAHASSDAH